MTEEKAEEKLHGKEVIYPEPYDEIDLLNLFKVLLKRARFIISFVFFASLLAIIISLSMRPIYRSSAKIVPSSQKRSAPLSVLSGISPLSFGGGSLFDYKTVLESPLFNIEVIKRHNLLPKLFEDLWDKKKNSWKKGKKIPSLMDAYRRIQKGFMKVNVDSKSNTLDISFETESPLFSKELCDIYIHELSEYLREKEIDECRERQKYFRDQMKKAQDVLLRDKLARLLAKEIEREVMARSTKYFGFKVLDPPIVPDKKVRPKRRLICIVSFVSSLFLAIFLAFF